MARSRPTGCTHWIHRSWARRGFRPDIDLSDYTEFLAGGTAIQFRDVPDRWHNSRSIETADAFYIDERRKASLRELFDDAFDNALDGVRSFDRATEAGPNAIAVQGFLTDVISGVPPYIPGKRSHEHPLALGSQYRARGQGFGESNGAGPYRRARARQRADRCVDGGLVDHPESSTSGRSCSSRAWSNCGISIRVGSVVSGSAAATSALSPSLSRCRYAPF